MSDQTRILTARMLDLKKGSTVSMQDYITEMTGYADELEIAGKKLEDNKLMFLLLRGLPSAYEEFKQQISSRISLLTLEEFISELLNCNEVVVLAGGEEQNSDVVFDAEEREVVEEIQDVEREQVDLRTSCKKCGLKFDPMNPASHERACARRLKKNRSQEQSGTRR